MAVDSASMEPEDAASFSRLTAGVEHWAILCPGSVLLLIDAPCAEKETE
jgi:hypothetical protein